MHIIIKDINKLIHYDLNYEEINYKGIKIYKNIDYYISLSENLSFEDKEKIKILEEKIYHVLDDDKFYKIEIYVYNSFNNSFSLYHNNSFLISSDLRSTIKSNDKYLKSFYLYYKDGHIRSNYDGLLLNGNIYHNEKLREGDYIEMLSFAFYYYKDFLYIRDFYEKNDLNKYRPKEIIFKYKNNYRDIKYYLPDINRDNYEIKRIAKIKFERYKDNNIFLQILPSLTISLSILFIGYMNYKNNPSSFIYLLMPISILISSVAIPIMIHYLDKRKINNKNSIIRNNYLEYLNNYEKELNDYIKKEEADNKKKSNILINGDYFKINKNSLDYLKIYLGQKEEKLNLIYEKTNDKLIDKKLEEIDYNARIINEPIYLDLNKNRINTLIINEEIKEYIFHMLLLNLASSHNFNDLKIGIYSKDENIYKYIYDLPHLFIHKKRMTFNLIKDLHELDQIKINEDFILFIYDNLNYHFNNQDLKIIYFSSDINDIYENSDCVIKYNKNFATMYEDKEINFSYYINDLNYSLIYQKLGLYNNALINKDNYYFIDNFCDFDIKKNYLNKVYGLEANFSYKDKQLFSIDIHESKCGPHGLIGGSTGSGKSELIISFLLSLAIKYPPDYLNMIIIDYKGGGIVESLSYKDENIPHIIAKISNLEKDNFERLLFSIRNECLRREEIFKKLTEVSKQPIFDIDTYLLKYENYNFSKMAHLLIVVDEFAELKKEHNEYIKELISLSRIGRSLGLHLILATQKPGGNIDEEIWSNSRFKIALKTLEDRDSLDLIKTKDACFLKEKGEFYILVDDKISKAKSIYSKKDYLKREAINISLLDNKLESLENININNKNILLECNYFSKEIIKISKELNIKTNEFIYEKNKAQDILLKKDNNFYIGQKDDYFNQDFKDIIIPINENILIYSSRKDEINYYLNNLDINEREFILISNNKYKYAYLRDLINYDENEDIDYLFDYLLNHHLNNLTLVIEEINQLYSYNEIYLDKIIKIIKRKNNEDFNLIIFSNNSNISFKLINQFNYKFAIKINDKTDLFNIFNNQTNYLGDSFYYEDKLYPYIPINIQKAIEKEKIVDNLINKIPENIKAHIIDDKSLIGYDTKTREKIYISNDINLFIISFENKYLINYQKYHFKKMIYNRELKRIDDNFLWLGKGIFRQQLFIPNISHDLRDDEGYLQINNEIKIVRILNDV